MNVDALVTDVAGTNFVTFDGTVVAGPTTSSIILSTATAALADATAAAALFELTSSSDNLMTIDDTDKFILLRQDDDATSVTDFDAQVFMVSRSGTDIIGEQIAIIDNAADSSILAIGDFVL